VSEEVWKDIPGFEGRYKVSNHGRVYSYVRGNGRYLKPQDRDGYLVVFLFPKVESGYRQEKWDVHRLVMLAFVGPLPEGFHTNHKNGIRTENLLENLEYVTPKENSRHAADVLGIVLGTRGEAHGKAKLTVEIVRMMRREYRRGSKQVAGWAEKYSTTTRSIYAALCGDSWKVANV
jgi:hypothetical protein